MERKFEPLTATIARRIGEQLERAREFVREFYPDDSDDRLSLESLDRAFLSYLESESTPARANAVVLAVGAAFGTRLVDELGFRWVIATDDYGTDLAVLARPGWGNVAIFPAEFVAKSHDRREAPFLVDAFAGIQSQLSEIAAEWGDVA